MESKQLATCEHGVPTDLQCPKCQSLLPNFGTIGQTAEQFEQDRLRGIAARGEVDRAPVLVKDVKIDARERAAMQEVMRLVLREMSRDVQAELGQLREDIKAQNRLLTGIDTPLENIADSHERATHSFETLRAENAEMREAIVELTRFVRTHIEYTVKILDTLLPLLNAQHEATRAIGEKLGLTL